MQPIRRRSHTPDKEESFCKPVGGQPPDLVINDFDDSDDDFDDIGDFDDTVGDFDDGSDFDNGGDVDDTGDFDHSGGDEYDGKSPDGRKRTQSRGRS